MKIEIVGRNYNVSDHLRDVTEQKLAKLDKYFADDQTYAKVSFKKEAAKKFRCSPAIKVAW